ncbi:MAG: hypothetical protein IPP90_13315 [Gemmatimonadaceae bacterium]|nr:hypothetical protein [Gemmatimonadaceae bacterium]
MKRAKTLLAAGAIAERDVEGAERALTCQRRRNWGRRRFASPARWRRTCNNATIRAPFASIVAEKSVSPSDIVAPGAALFTVIDRAA